MKEDNRNKVRLLFLWDILRKETDEEHPMRSSVLIKKMQDKGVDCSRQTLYSDIDALNAYGFEVLCRRSIGNEYYVIDRDFDVPEIQILMDAVNGANFITAKKSKALIDKLAVLAGTQQGEVMKNGLIEFDTMKGNNEAIYYTISEIAFALKEQKKVGFYYCNLDLKGNLKRRKRASEPTEDRWYEVNPVKTVDQDGKYYLICYDDKHGKLSQYRIDRMESAKVLDAPITPSKEAETEEVLKHKQSLVGMFGGRVEQVTFMGDYSVLDAIYDKFGKQIKPFEYEGGKIGFNVNVQISKPLLTWIIGFGKTLKVTSPASVVDEIKALLQEATENYE